MEDGGRSITLLSAPLLKVACAHPYSPATVKGSWAMLNIIDKQAEGVFQPEEVTILIAAFDCCWERFQQSGIRFGSERAMQGAREQVGKGITQRIEASVTRGGSARTRCFT